MRNVSLKKKTFFITGASRGIGKAIALKLASHGAQIAIVAKSIKEDDRLGGTIFSAAEEVNKAGGSAIAIQCDIRDEEQIIKAVRQTISIFDGIDGLINNASAISLTRTADTETKKFDLMFDINVRGTFFVTKHCIPFLRHSENPHILCLSPPINMNWKWFSPHIAYTTSKYNMSMMAMGWAEELRSAGIASNCLWPSTIIATAAIKNLLGGEEQLKKSRKPEIVADAAYGILTKPAKEYTGNIFIDEYFLRAEGITDFAKYAVDPDEQLQKDLFV
jgi:citronellol/citronellal dehydrogenase